MTEDEFAMPTAAVAFSRHFTHPLYDDHGDDLAPFGSDEGSGMLWEWGDRRDELDRSSTLATVLECDPAAVARVAGPMRGVDGIQTAGFISSAAFVLLRLTGHLDEAGRHLALDALAFQIKIFPTITGAAPDQVPEVLLVQQADLTSWRNPD